MRGKPITDAAVAVVLMDKGDSYVVLGRHPDDRTFVGLCLPGGKLEPDEMAESAVVREVKEETGFDIRLVGKLGEYESDIAGKPFRIYGFVAIRVGGDSVEFPNREHARMQVFNRGHNAFGLDSISYRIVGDFFGEDAGYNVRYKTLD